jgi:hypothetical protein
MYSANTTGSFRQELIILQVPGNAQFGRKWLNIDSFSSFISLVVLKFTIGLLFYRTLGPSSQTTRAMNWLKTEAHVLCT